MPLSEEDKLSSETQITEWVVVHAALSFTGLLLLDLAHDDRARLPSARFLILPLRLLAAAVQSGRPFLLNLLAHARHYEKDRLETDVSERARSAQFLERLK